MLGRLANDIDIVFDQLINQKWILHGDDSSECLIILIDSPDYVIFNRHRTHLTFIDVLQECTVADFLRRAMFGTEVAKYRNHNDSDDRPE